MPSAEGLVGVRAGAPLAALTTLGVGGPAGWLVRATAIEEVSAAHKWSRERALPFTVIGGGSNLVIADTGVEGLVLQVAMGGVSFSARGEKTLLRLAAGEPWDAAVAEAVSRGLAGIECLSGIPGSAGGTPVQNVGAYGQEVAETLLEVTVFDCQSGEVGTLSGADCAFGYRTSRFKSEDAGRFVLCEVVYELCHAPPTATYPDVTAHLERCGIRSPTLAQVRDAVLSVRRRKGMVLDASDPDTRSVGSFFMNPIVAAGDHVALRSTAGPAPGFPMPGGQVKVPAAWLIEQAGFSRGYSAGAVGLSSKHPLAIVNRGGASAREVVTLARQIKQQVVDRFGVWLRPEPTFLGFGSDADVAYLLEGG